MFVHMHVSFQNLWYVTVNTALSKTMSCNLATQVDCSKDGCPSYYACICLNEYVYKCYKCISVVHLDV